MADSKPKEVIPTKASEIGSVLSDERTTVTIQRNKYSEEQRIEIKEGYGDSLTMSLPLALAVARRMIELAEARP